MRKNSQKIGKVVQKAPKSAPKWYQNRSRRVIFSISAKPWFLMTVQWFFMVFPFPRGSGRDQKSMKIRFRKSSVKKSDFFWFFSVFFWFRASLLGPFSAILGTKWGATNWGICVWRVFAFFWTPEAPQEPKRSPKGAQKASKSAPKASKKKKQF